MTHYLLAIDQGTTSSRAIIFSFSGEPLSHHQIDVQLFYPHEGWVEHDPDEIWTNTYLCCQEALKKINLSANNIAAIGISNQRETTIIWDKKTGKAIYPAIVWQDRRTSVLCEKLKENKSLANIQQKTGLLLDPYFSATKIMWLLDNVPYAREKALKGELLFGTIDTFLLWKLTQGRAHATDATNASRTMLFNIHTQQWDNEILQVLEIPPNILPEVLNSSAQFGHTAKDLFGESIAICGIAGDQQAATIGQACFSEGMIKCTYGTGCFMLLNTGNTPLFSQNKLLTTIAYRLENKTVYGLEGSIFCAGATIKWLRDSLKLIHTAAESEELAKSIQNTEGVYLVPAFTGLGAPYWNSHARAAILGLTRNTGVAQIVRAALEAVAYQTCDLLNAMKKDGVTQLKTLRVDGGMVANNWLLQFLADILTINVQRSHCLETSALGAAYLAGLGAGVYHSLEQIAELWRSNANLEPTMPISTRESLYQGWLKAVFHFLKP
ncbi:MAG TPA: glycerol kinase GlpK [Gammaproteobacteria bacterium]|nr:glycerol kinase GlpK [Gammaproteobacteria bacterium]